jgi:hypothetical protein
MQTNETNQAKDVKIALNARQMSKNQSEFF